MSSEVTGRRKRSSIDLHANYYWHQLMYALEASTFGTRISHVPIYRLDYSRMVNPIGISRVSSSCPLSKCFSTVLILVQQFSSTLQACRVRPTALMGG